MITVGAVATVGTVIATIASYAVPAIFAIWLNNQSLKASEEMQEKSMLYSHSEAEAQKKWQIFYNAKLTKEQEKANKQATKQSNAMYEDRNAKANMEYTKKQFATRYGGYTNRRI